MHYTWVVYGYSKTSKNRKPMQLGSVLAETKEDVYEETKKFLVENF